MRQSILGFNRHRRSSVGCLERILRRIKWHILLRWNGRWRRHGWSRRRVVIFWRITRLGWFISWNESRIKILLSTRRKRVDEHVVLSSLCRSNYPQFTMRWSDSSVEQQHFTNWSIVFSIVCVPLRAHLNRITATSGGHQVNWDKEINVSYRWRLQFENEQSKTFYDRHAINQKPKLVGQNSTSLRKNPPFWTSSAKRTESKRRNQISGRCFEDSLSGRYDTVQSAVCLSFPIFSNVDEIEFHLPWDRSGNSESLAHVKHLSSAIRSSSTEIKWIVFWMFHWLFFRGIVNASRGLSESHPTSAIHLIHFIWNVVLDDIICRHYS